MKKWNQKLGKRIGLFALSAMLAGGNMGFAVPAVNTFASETTSGEDTANSANSGSSTTEEPVSSRDTDIVLTGLNAPAAKYGQNTTVGFIAKLRGEGYIKSIIPVVSAGFPFESNDAAYMITEGDATTKELSANYNFVVRSDVESGYQTVAFNIEYVKDGVEYSVIKTVNIKFEGEAVTTTTEAPTTEKPLVSTPRVIVTGFETNPTKVLAGEEFTLTLHLQNASNRTAVSNMKISLEAANGEFLPSSGSSTQFVSSLGSGKTTDLTLKMSALSSLEPKPYVLTLTCNYEDGEANPFESKENISIPVYQEARIKITDVSVSPETIGVYNQGSVSFSINNLGRSTLTNVQARLEGDSIESEESFVGNIAAGASGYADVMVTGIEPTTDDGTVKLIITYEDSAGEECTYEDEVTVFVMEEMPEDSFFDSDEFPEEEPGMPFMQKILIGVGILVVLAVIVVVIVIIVIKNKKRKAAEEAEALEDELDEDLLSDIDKEN